MASIINDVLGPRLVGRDAADIVGIRDDLADWAYRYGDQGILLMGVSGIDLALWDLASTADETTVCELLGGPRHDNLPAYASLPWLRSGELVLAETRRAIDAGFGAVKLHEVEPGIVADVRREFGPDLGVMVDVNGYFAVADGIDHGRQLDELDVCWFEEPVKPVRDHEAIARVGAVVRSPLAAGENEYLVGDFERLLDRTQVRYVQPEITKIGGLTAAGAVGAVIERHGRELCPHSFRVGPSMIASMHWAFASAAAGWIEIPWFAEDVDCSYPTNLPDIRDGRVEAPSATGLSQWR